MKASDLVGNDFIKVLLYGDSGTGKTILSTDFPGPIEYWDFDGKISSAVGYLKKKNPAKLNEIDVHQFHKFPRETRIAEFEKRAREVSLLHNAKKDLPFKTLVLDSLTTFTESMLSDYLYRSQKGIKRGNPDLPAQQDYGLLDKHLIHIIGNILSLDCNVVVTGHLSIDKDETTGAMERTVLMPGKFAKKLPIFFEEVYVTKVNANGDYVLQTKTDMTYKCRSQRDLPKEIASSYKAIMGEK